MKKIFLKKYWTALISVPVIAGGIVLACAGGEIDEFETSSFTPEGFVDSSYRPFFYSWNFYYGIGHDEAHNTRFSQANVNDWSAYLGNNVPVDELNFLLNEASAGIADSATAYVAGKVKVLPPSIRSFKIVAAKNSKVADFLNYLAIAKKCEEFAVVEYYRWEEVPKKGPIPTAAKLNSELLSRFNKTKDQFLKQRYWFQAVRSYFFNGPLQQSVDLFENNKNAFPANTFYYRTLAYAAGAYYKQKNFSKANYYYSKVYDGCKELKTVAHYSFHPQEEADWKNTLALCQNKNELATLWQMLGVFYEDELRAISEIHSIDPSSEKLDLLLVRAINKEEQKFSGWRERQLANDLKLVNEPLNQSLSLLINRIARAANAAKPYLWYIAAGYLKTLDGDFKGARVDYASAEKTLPSQKLPRFQLRLLKLMNKVADVRGISKNFENEILADVRWLKDSVGSVDHFRTSRAFEWLRQSISYEYSRQKDFVKAECFRSTPSFYASNSNVDAMKAFIDKQGKSPYEQLCVSMYDKSKEDLLEYQAVRHALQDKLPEAIAFMEKAGSLKEKELWGNPFNGRINDCHDCDHEATQKISYSKLSLLKKMKEMQDKVRKGEDVYSNAVLLGNAFYSMSHYGNARFFYEGSVLGAGHYSPFSIDSAFIGFLIDMTQSTKYYSVALQAATTAEQKAKCHFMLAKCERNQWYNTELYSGKEYGTDLPVDFKAWESFKALKEYSNTQYYKEVIQECGYFRTYISKN